MRQEWRSEESYGVAEQYTVQYVTSGLRQKMPRRRYARRRVAPLKSSSISSRRPPPNTRISSPQPPQSTSPRPSTSPGPEEVCSMTVSGISWVFARGRRCAFCRRCFQCENWVSGSSCRRQYARCVSPLSRQASICACRNSRRPKSVAMTCLRLLAKAQIMAGTFGNWQMRFLCRLPNRCRETITLSGDCRGSPRSV